MLGKLYIYDFDMIYIYYVLLLNVFAQLAKFVNAQFMIAPIH